jgi:glutathione S-transferase
VGQFGSALLGDIARFYNAADDAALASVRDAITARFAQVEARLSDGPWFAGQRFGMVDAVFGPVFRYFDAFERIDNFSFFAATPRVCAWRAALAERATVRDAVAADYPQRLAALLLARGSELSRRMAAQ